MNSTPHTGAFESEVAALRAESLTKIYPARTATGGALTLFRELSFSVHAGEFVAITGRSGTGKSSLLHLLAGLDEPTAGRVLIGGQAMTSLHADARAALRNRAIGYVWQAHYLLPEFTAAENIAMPLLARGEPRAAALAAAARWLERVGLAGRAAHRAGELSGGEQQRVSLARALVTGPQVLLADEPTGDLDDATAAELLELLLVVTREARLASVVVTHSRELARAADRHLQLRDGALL